jgi:hypothetical protein
VIGLEREVLLERRRVSCYEELDLEFWLLEKFGGLAHREPSPLRRECDFWAISCKYSAAPFCTKGAELHGIYLAICLKMPLKIRCWQSLHPCSSRGNCYHCQNCSEDLDGALKAAKQINSQIDKHCVESFVNRYKYIK